MRLYVGLQRVLQRFPIVFAITSGILLGGAFPQVVGPWAGVLSVCALVPLLLLIATRAPDVSRTRIVVWLYSTFVIYHGLTNWWVCSWQERTDPYLFASGIALWLGHPFFLMLPFVALASIRRRLGVAWMLVLTPASIAGFEWLHGQTDASYPWLTIGYTVVRTPLAQIADVVGVYGLSFMIALVNAAIAWVVLHRSDRSVVRQGSIAIALFMITWFAVGAARTVGPNPSSTVRALLVQPNEDPWNKWSDPELQLSTHLRISDSARSVISSSRRSVDVVVWSETALPFLIRDQRHREQWNTLRTWVDTSSVPLITGLADVYVYPRGTAPASARRSASDPDLRYDAFNAAMVLNPSTNRVALHYKSMLTPFAERLPFADQLTFAMSWIEWGVGISAWGKGQTRLPLPVLRGADTLARIGTIICIESIYPEVARDMVNNGADLLCVITNDAWYNGTWGPPQHFDIARMRAIEQRRALIRCAQSGVTGAILPDGTDAGTLFPVMQRGALVASVPTQTGRTFYARVGDPVPILGLLFTIFAIVAARIPAYVRVLSTRSNRTPRLSTTEKSHL